MNTVYYFLLELSNYVVRVYPVEIIYVTSHWSVRWFFTSDKTKQLQTLSGICLVFNIRRCSLSAWLIDRHSRLLRSWLLWHTCTMTSIYLHPHLPGGKRISKCPLNFFFFLFFSSLVPYKWVKCRLKLIVLNGKLGDVVYELSCPFCNSNKL